MSIMAFHGSRLARAAAVITLTSFIAGCLPQNVKSSGDSLLGAASSINGSAGNLLAQLGSTTAAFTEFTGIDLPGTARGMDNRSWTADDQLAALDAEAVFRGDQLDDLPVYNPLSPGEAKRYKDKISRLAVKYKGRTTLKPDEMRELAEAIVPVVRYLAKSRTYRESVKEAAKLTRNPKGQASVVIPAGMTLEVALLTYCNDHGLPAPWSGSKLSMRSAGLYIPDDLRELYSDLHEYAATHPAAHYQMQSTVWWIRGGTCNFDALSDKQKQMIEAAHTGGVQKLQSYCTQQKIKKQVASKVMQSVPGMGAGSQLADLKRAMETAADYQAKAQALLAADLSNPDDLLQLAKTSGLTNKIGSASLLKNPQLANYAPLLNQAGFAKALIPNTASDRAVATSLSVMEELGRQIGEQQGADKGSLANYSKLSDSVFVEATHNGGANNAFIKVRNTGTSSVELSGSDFVLTTVNDTERGHKSFQPTQRLSIGPMQPVRVYPNESDAAKRYTLNNDKSAIDALSPMKGMESVLEGEPDQDVAEQCAEREKASPGTGTLRFGDYGLGIIRDVVQTIPVIGNVVYAYSALTGKDWMTGSDLSTADRAVAALGATLPVAGILGGLKAGITLGKGVVGTWKAIRAGETAGSNMVAFGTVGIKASEGVFAFNGDDACTAASAGATAVANVVCGTSGKVACSAYTMVASALGNLPQVRADTDDESMQDFTTRLEYAMAPGGMKPETWKPPIIKDALNWVKAKL